MNFSRNHGLLFSNLIWLGAVLAAFGAAWLKGMPVTDLWPYGAVAIVPAVGGLLLWPFSHKEWAQVFILMLWTALAITACLAMGFFPAAFLFLCAPLVAALFKREKVLEATILSALFAAAVFAMQRYGYAPDPLASAVQSSWGGMVAIAATIAFMIGAMFFSASQSDSETIVIRDDENILPSTSFTDAYPGAALMFSSDAVLQGATDKALSMFGLSDKDFGKMPIGSIVSTHHGDDVGYDGLKIAFANVVENGETVSTMVTPTNENHSRKSIELDFVPQKSGQIYVFASDRTDMISKIESLETIQSNANKEAAEKTLFFAGVSHELRTPLNAIIGFSDMMRSRLFGPLPGKYAEYADLIHDSGQHMLDLIGDVLDMSKVEAGKYELHYDDFDVADVVRSSIKMVQPAADAAELSLSAEIDVNDDMLIQADRRAVRQILLNLLSNAIKFTPRGGRIVVAAKNVQGVLNLSVEDNGMGISPAELKNIGNAFTQAKSARLVDARGSGLGLSLVKNLVKLHKGRTAITSHPGAGTSVNIYLPIEKSAE